jgi:hypothetical protein
LVGFLIENLLDVGEGDGLVCGSVLLHGRAGVEEDACPDGKIAEGFESNDAAGWVAIVEQTQFVETEIVYGEAVFVGGMKGQFDLVDGDFQVVGLRICVARSRYKDREAESRDDPRSHWSSRKAYFGSEGSGERSRPLDFTTSPVPLR